MKRFLIQNEKHELQVSKVIFGTTYLGNMGEKEAFPQLDRYFELGGRCIDTARIYSNFEPDDRRPSEEVIGAWFQSTGLRKEIVLSTKGAHPPFGKMDQSRLGRDDLCFDLEQSLNALKTDYIDLYWLHRDDVNVPVEGVVDTLNDFARQGMVRCFGASNWSVERLLEANSYAEKSGQLGFSASQIQWSLALCTPQSLGDPTLVCMTDETRRAYLEHGIPVMAYNAQAKGLFSKLAQCGEEDLPQKVKKRFLCSELRQENLARFHRVMELSKQYGVSPAVITLAFLTGQKLPTGTIIGCSKISQLEDSMMAQDFQLKPEEIRWLEGK